MLAALLAAGAGLRWCYLGAPSFHPDEVYPVTLADRHAATGSLDLNLSHLGFAGMPEGDQYAGSFYHRVVILWDSGLRWTGASTLVRVRALSALAATLALILFARLAWRQAGFAAGAVAVALTAANPVLVQDAHFARPDALLLLLLVAFLGACASDRPPGRLGALVPGLLLGLLVALKTTMGALILVPPALALLAGAGMGAALRAALRTGAVAALVFLVAVPESWLHPQAYLTGLRLLSTQYSNPFPAQGPIDGGTTFGMAARYFYATLGPGTAILAAAGAASWARRDRRSLVLWIAPAAVFSVLFGLHTNFFERSYGTFLPGVFLAAGLGAATLAARGRWAWLAAVLVVVAVVPGARVTRILVSQALSGRAEAAHQAYSRRLRTAAAPVPLFATWMCSPNQLEACLYTARTAQGPFILAVGDFGDDWTARMLAQFRAKVHPIDIAVVHGPFEGLPMSSLPCYNAPTFRYLWVGQPPPPRPLPQP